MITKRPIGMPMVIAPSIGVAQPPRGEGHEGDVAEIDDQHRRGQRRGEPRPPRDERLEVRIPPDGFDQLRLRAHEILFCSTGSRFAAAAQCANRDRVLDDRSFAGRSKSISHGLVRSPCGSGLKKRRRRLSGAAASSLGGAQVRCRSEPPHRPADHSAGAAFAMAPMVARRSISSKAASEAFSGFRSDTTMPIRKAPVMVMMHGFLSGKYHHLLMIMSW